MAKPEKAVGKNKPAKKAKKDSKKLSKKAKKEQGHKLVLRPLHATDYPSFKRAMDAAYPTLGGAWVEEQFLSQIKRFPEGQLCIEDKGEVIAAAVSVIVQYDQYGDNHSYKEITGNGYLTTHDPTAIPSTVSTSSCIQTIATSVSGVDCMRPAPTFATTWSSRSCLG